MSEQPAEMKTQAEILSMLAWQLDMGADEAIVDHPNQAAHPVNFDASLTNNAAEITNAAPRNNIPNNAVPNVTITSDALTVLPTPPMHESAAGGAKTLETLQTLDALQVGLNALDDCPLKHTASNLCFADGNPGARLMIIGEVPGRDEDRMGIPFVGAAGQLLDRMIASIGLDRSMVYLTTLIPWRPPGNRTPTAEEITMLTPWIYRHIQLVKPDYLLLLGGASAKLILGGASQGGRDDGIMKLRGRWQSIDFGDGIMRPVMASLHPSYLLRSPAQKRLAFIDLVAVARRLDDAGDIGQAEM